MMVSCCTGATVIVKAFSLNIPLVGTVCTFDGNPISGWICATSSFDRSGLASTTRKFDQLSVTGLATTVIAIFFLLFANPIVFAAVDTCRGWETRTILCVITRTIAHAAPQKQY